ncbi:MAG: hypothetical protein ACTSUF_12885 [Candidatus Heimdallarchaeaceae archaeon]
MSKQYDNPFMQYIETGQIDFSAGHLKLFNQSMVMFPTTTYVNFHKKCINLGEKGKKLIFDIGWEQVKTVFSKFDKDYKITKMDAERFTQLFAPTIKTCGWGDVRFEQIKLDKGQETIVIINNNPFAYIYKKILGIQKEGVDDYLLGLFAAGIYAISGKKVAAKETKCIAKGDKHCEFIIKIKT